MPEMDARYRGLTSLSYLYMTNGLSSKRLLTTQRTEDIHITMKCSLEYFYRINHIF